MSKYIYISLVAFILFNPFSLKAQESETLAQSQIKLQMKFQEENWNMGNIEGFMQAYWRSDSLLFLGSKGPTYGWLRTLTNYQKAYPDAAAMGKLSFKLIDLKILSDEYAYMLGSWHLEREKDSLGGHFSLLWLKVEGKWKIVSDHTSSN
ncbi:MAG: nuclear transport factor 2 family protein [Vicingaceae bacterium]